MWNSPAGILAPRRRDDHRESYLDMFAGAGISSDPPMLLPTFNSVLTRVMLDNPPLGASR
jgi:hypothetical protein